MNDHQLAAAAAEAAGRSLLALRGEGGASGRQLGEAGDLIANRIILAMLREHRPGDAILSEESADSADRLAAERVWIVDPLDGTREYSEGRADWAVHVALAERGTAVAGAVALPAQGAILSTDRPPVSVSPIRLHPLILVSRSRPPAEAARVAAAIEGDLVPMGSAGAKAMAVVQGAADIYLHSGGQYEWDSCAPVAVAQAAGLHVSRIDGSPLVYNRADPLLPDLLVCRHDYAASILGALAAIAAPAMQGAAPRAVT